MKMQLFGNYVYSRYEFLSAVSHMADNLPTEQLQDVNSSDDDETETMWMKHWQQRLQHRYRLRQRHI